MGRRRRCRPRHRAERVAQRRGARDPLLGPDEPTVVGPPVAVVIDPGASCLVARVDRAGHDRLPEPRPRPQRAEQLGGRDAPDGAAEVAVTVTVEVHERVARRVPPVQRRGDVVGAEARRRAEGARDALVRSGVPDLPAVVRAPVAVDVRPHTAARVAEIEAGRGLRGAPRGTGRQRAHQRPRHPAEVGEAVAVGVHPGASGGVAGADRRGEPGAERGSRVRRADRPVRRQPAEIGLAVTCRIHERRVGDVAPFGHLTWTGVRPERAQRRERAVVVLLGPPTRRQ